MTREIAYRCRALNAKAAGIRRSRSALELRASKSLALCAIAVGLLGLGRAGPLPFVDSQFRVSVTKDLVYGAAAIGRSGTGDKLLRLDLYEPSGDNAPVLRPGFVAIHGGSLGTADKGDANVAELCRDLAARGYLCASINYRMGADDPPTEGATLLRRVVNAGVQDSALAIGWLRRGANQHRLDGTRIAVGGSSSGAEIALRVAYDSATSVAAVLSWSGGLDGDEAIMEAGEPALFVAHGTDDSAVLISEAKALVARARARAVPYAAYFCVGLGHTVPLDRRPGGVPIYRRLASFLSDQLGLPTAAPHAPPRETSTPIANTETTPIPCPR